MLLPKFPLIIAELNLNFMDREKAFFQLDIR
jgi:hypothetical protein